MPPALVPLALGNQTVIEQPLDLSKKEALVASTTKESDISSRNISSPCEQKDDNSVSNVDNDDLEDSPLVIDEETAIDPIEPKRTPTNGEIITKVIMKNKISISKFYINNIIDALSLLESKSNKCEK